MKIMPDYTTRAELAALDQDKWDKRFLEIAKQVSGWSSCIRPGRQVGAVVANGKRILTTGYNGACSGIVSCKDKGICLRDQMKIESGTRQEICYAVHAEQNAIIQAAKVGLCVDGATIYCTHQPCVICAKIIINSGIKRVVYINGYPDDFARQMFAEAGVTLTQINE